MICARCGLDNLEGRRFCTACGAPLVISETVDTVVEPLRRPASAQMAGRVIDGKYRIDSVLDHGGMGVVYRATRVMIGDGVALKLLHSDRLQEPGSRERFQREAQAAARLKHENAVTIYDFGVTTDGLVYLVMELVEGESLAKIIHRQGALPVELCVEAMKQICAAVGEAHRHNIVHRDLKPDNVILRGTGSTMRVKVLDFGIAKLQDSDVSRLTQTGAVVGTPHYMSPEQCMGQELDGRSDVYSLGVVLFEMLTGRVPFSATTPTAVVVQQVTQAPPAPCSINPGIPEAVEKVILRALEKKREARPQSAEDLSRELTAAAETERPPMAETRMGAIPAGSAGQGQGTQPTTPAETGIAAPQYGGPTARHGTPQHTVDTLTGSAGGRQVSGGETAYGQMASAPGGASWPAHSPSQAPAPAYSPGQTSGRSNRTAIFVAVVFGILILVVGAILLGLVVLDRPAGNTNGNIAVISPTPSPGRPVRSPNPPINLDAVAGEVTDTLNEWAAAITARDLDSLMSHYADELQPYYLAKTAGVSKIRQDMIRAYNNYDTTTITVSNVLVEPAADGLRATVRFDKAFDFIGQKRYTGSVQEEMWLAKTGGRWLITGLADLRVYYSNSTPVDEPTP
jgi:hypothetical protein